MLQLLVGLFVIAALALAFRESGDLEYEPDSTQLPSERYPAELAIKPEDIARQGMPSELAEEDYDQHHELENRTHVASEESYSLANDHEREASVSADTGH